MNVFGIRLNLVEKNQLTIIASKLIKKINFVIERFKAQLMKIVFATNNRNKLKEVMKLLKGNIELITLEDIGCIEEIPEDQLTLEGNAAEKSFFIYNKFGVDCFADDTGLEIEALNGEPGVYSARYAGLQKNDNDNMDKVLDALKGVENRRARFRTVISLIIDGKEIQVEGIVNGTILTERQGDGGFGYDPIFKADGFKKSFAEMTMEEKNLISHRGQAVKKLAEYLNGI